MVWHQGKRFGAPTLRVAHARPFPYRPPAARAVELHQWAATSAAGADHRWRSGSTSPAAAQTQFTGRWAVGMSVLSVPSAFILSGALAWPQTQTTGTMGASSTTAGRRVSVLPCRAPLARLPNRMWIAPPSTVTDFTTLLTILSAAGSPALALSSGMVLVTAQAAATGSLAILASGMASTMFSQMYLLARLGTAMSARMAMMATTTINSINEKPWRRVLEVFTWGGRPGAGWGWWHSAAFAEAAARPSASSTHAPVARRPTPPAASCRTRRRPAPRGPPPRPRPPTPPPPGAILANTGTAGSRWPQAWPRTP